MRICCGTYTTRTPLLSSTISYLQVNPDWIIPQKIVESDISRHAGDSSYFARNHYYIIERSTGDTLRAAKVSAAQLRTGRLRVGQKGGAGNSLGRIVFRFPNNFAVYLHDTNNRGAFQRERRTLSHGCIRVQKPFELACFLLPDADEWTKDRLRISMDIHPETTQGQAYVREHAGAQKPFRLISYQDVTPKVPLYIIYYTAYPNPKTGVVELWPDLYGYDQTISREMGSILL
jgi:murein L,D-transpeptidase YcbB/YkuD